MGDQLTDRSCEAPERTEGRPSLRDIAEKVGVSHVAVSLALKDSPRVSPERRAQIRAMAEKMGYRPDPMLSSLAAYRQGKRPVEIQSCMAWINQWADADALRGFNEFNAYWRGATAAAESLGYRLEEFRWPRGKSGKRLQNILLNRDVRGILIPPHRRGMDLPDFDWSAFSLVRFGASVNNIPALCVTSDQSHCARLAVEKAIALGYRRIGYFSSVLFERNTGGHFREGFLNTQMEFFGMDQRIFPMEVPDESLDCLPTVQKWLDNQEPDVVITTIGFFYRILEKMGMTCPDDLAVAVISVLDGNFDAGVDQNSYEIGRVAANALAGMIIRNERGIPRYGRRILVEGRWVDGRSLPPKDSGKKATIQSPH